MATPPTTPENLTSFQVELLQANKLAALAKRAKATAARKKQVEMNKLIEDFETKEPKKKVARKLTWENAEKEIRGLAQELVPQAFEKEEELKCYCDDEAKLCTSKKDRQFLTCPNTRWDSEKKKYESDCDFFVMVDDLLDDTCKCKFPMRLVKAKKDDTTYKVCLYKNAPTLWKKSHHYDCNQLIKL
jgi:hypothetical protein